MSSDKEKWFSYSAIRFTAEQVEWILQNLTTFEAGRWPKEPSGRDLENPDSAYSTGSAPEELTGTGDYFTKTYKVYSTGDKASFVKPALIAAEITARMDMCGRDGEMCRQYYEAERVELEISVVNRVKAYISGWNRRTISYWDWCRRKRRS